MLSARLRGHRLRWPGAALSMVLLAAGCRGASGAPARLVAGGDPARGPAAISRYGCGSCHTIPGVRDAHGLVGPPLTHWAARAYIAGEVPNRPATLITWLTVPQSIEPGTAMPNLGVSDEAARDIAAYLYTIR